MAATYRFSTAEGHRVGRRAIGFLEEDIPEGEGESRVDAKEVFDTLTPHRKCELRTRFDYWLDWGINDRWFHGWPNDHEVKACFCFKWSERRQNHRLYGFLFHPKPTINPGFQVCVLVYHDAKNDESTDRSLLIRVMGLYGNPVVHAAIRFIFPDKKNGEQIQ